MANNAWNTLLADVNDKIAEMNTATSDAKGAAAEARSAADTAATETEKAVAAAAAARSAAAEAGKWQNVTVSATTLAEGESPTVSLTETEDGKKIEYGIPPGQKGADGQKGEPGRSGVTFRLVGDVLYIETEA